jgi:N-acetylglucosaminyl-diphospho-decaprenol L-rhamnosyltransferase
MLETNASLVTVSYNSAHTLSRFWVNWDGACEWIVVDNASTDGSADVARSLGARVVRLPKNVGFSAANNIGARTATGDVLGFVNPDVTPRSSDVDRLARSAVITQGVVAPQLVNADGSLQENGRAAPFPLRKLAHMFAPQSRVNSRYIRHVESGLQQVVWVMGAAVFTTRKTFERVGGWDDRYFIYYEDADFCLRALEQGVPTYVDGDVRMLHGWARETAKGKSIGIWKHELMSAARFYARHPQCALPLGKLSRDVREIERTPALLKVAR